MTLKTLKTLNFIEYLIEKKFTDEDGKVKFLIPTKKSPANATEIVQDLKDCLEYMKTHLSHFTISSRNINPATIKYMLNINDTSDDYTFCEKSNIKVSVIDKIIDIHNLATYLSKSEKSNNSHKGWIYEFIIPNYFGKVITVTGQEDEDSYKDPETRTGDMLYLKFNFLKCFDQNGKIIVDQSKLNLDVVSIHPTDRTRKENNANNANNANNQNKQSNNFRRPNFYYRKKW